MSLNKGRKNSMFKSGKIMTPLLCTYDWTFWSGNIVPSKFVQQALDQDREWFSDKISDPIPIFQNYFRSDPQSWKKDPILFRSDPDPILTVTHLNAIRVDQNVYLKIMRVRVDQNVYLKIMRARVDQNVYLKIMRVDQNQYLSKFISKSRLQCRSITVPYNL